MLPSILNDIVDVTLALDQRRPCRFNFKPGDSVSFSFEDVGGDMPLVLPHPHEALENEAFTGRACIKTTGWISNGQIGLVVAVIDDHAFLLCCEGNGWGWIDKQFIKAVPG